MRILSSASVLVLAASLMACSGTSVGTGTGDDGSSGSPGSSNNNGAGVNPGGGGTVTGGGTTTEGAGTGASEYDALFGKPATTALTPDSLSGLWAGTMRGSNDDVRVRIAGDAVTMAVRCNSGYSSSSIPVVVVGMEAAAVVSSSSIRLVESKSTGTSCTINVRPQTIARCGTVGSSSYDCFEVTGTTLDLNSATLFSTNGSSYGPNSAFTKISD